MPTPIYTPPTPQWVGSMDIDSDVVQTPDDGTFELAWGYKLTRKYEGLYSLLLSNIAFGQYNRGVVSDDYVIDHTRVTKSKGSKGRVEIDWQSIGGYLNPDEWSVEPEDLQPRIERHPNYASLLPADFAIVQQAINALNSGALAVAQNQFAGTSNPTLVQSLYTKMRRGFENYYLAAARYRWTQYYVSGDLPLPNTGGYTYVSPDGPAGYTLPAGFSWLRLADVVGQANWSPLGGIERITYSWLGAPNGYWDSDIYPASGS